MNNRTYHIVVKGLVQGVGFRPFIYRIALKHGLKGWVLNTNEDVRIRVSGDEEQIRLFLNSVGTEAPPAAFIERIDSQHSEDEVFPDFRILKSHDVSEDVTEVSPDIAVCGECLADMDVPGNRLDYSFTNCTNCGPRFTIIRDLPYDRAKTTMQHFVMCPDCRKEYETITDRRFHAQPVACMNCGPLYELFYGKEKNSTQILEILPIIARLLDQGDVIAMKGLGGMHLACDAFNSTAVRNLRDLKNREAKPFAVMFRDAGKVKEYTLPEPEEERSLLSWRRPIVLLKIRGNKGLQVSDVPSIRTISNQKSLAAGISSGLNLLGAMLPYLPFHYQLFRLLKTDALVMTSGNFSSEPIVIGNNEALEKFFGRTAAVVLHNREIFNRTDDSVIRIISGKERVFRRSRGYVPAPVRLALNCDGILAFGAELTNCFCVGKGRKAFLSQHIGDLKGLETTEFYEESMARYLQLFRVKPVLLAVDMHPDYISTRTSEKFLPHALTRIQHHHAHIASCMAEHGLDEKLIGVAFDGTGYGDDGNIWGAEFLVCDLADYSREKHFAYLPLPGGDLANEEPWRMAVSYLYSVFGRDFLGFDLPVLREVEKEKVEMILQMIDRNINCPLTSGAGRLFDAVASILGLCQVASFPAQGPMLVESEALAEEIEGYDSGSRSGYRFRIDNEIHFDEMIRQIVDDQRKGMEIAIICKKFHVTIISVIFETVKAIREKEGIRKVVLSGGVFQNKYLLEGTEKLLRKNNFEVYSHQAVTSNDGGIALGQLAIAAKRRALKCV